MVEEKEQLEGTTREKYTNENISSEKVSTTINE